MRKKIKTPRIIKIEKINGLKVYCMFNNGESRLIDFDLVFKNWNVLAEDVEYPLLDKNEFKKVQLRNHTLSWNNIPVVLLTENGKEQQYPYEIDPYVLFQKSLEIETGQ